MSILMQNNLNLSAACNLADKSSQVSDVRPEATGVSFKSARKCIRNIFRRDTFLVSAVLLVTLTGVTPSRSATLGLKSVYLGGVVSDMSNLSVPANTTGYRSVGGGFYAHESYILPNTSGNCPEQKASKALGSIIGSFGTSAGGLAEVGLSTPLGLTQLINCNYLAVGLNPTVAIANIIVGTTSLSSWKAFVDAGKSVGLMAVGPIVSPNVASQPANWNDKFWDDEKKMALYGGSLGMDTPPDLYKTLGPAYTTFAQQQLAWCKENGIACIDIISPSANEKDFDHDALAWAYAILAPGAAPASWVIENYNAGTEPSIGSESKAGSLTSTALALAYAVQPQQK